MSVYYDESPTFDHGKLRAYKTAGRTLAIFRKMQSWLSYVFVKILR